MAASQAPKLTLITAATLLLTMYWLERSTPSEALVLAETTNLMVAPLATPPDHSTSRAASISSPPPTIPGSLPLRITCVLLPGRPKVERKAATSVILMLLRPAMATDCPAPSKLVFQSGVRLYIAAKSYGPSPRAPPFQLVAGVGAGAWPSTWCIGLWRKSCKDATPPITGARASGIARSVALAKCRTPSTSYWRGFGWKERSSRTQALAELIGSTPFLEVRGGVVVLLRQQLFECRLLFRTAGELQLDALHGQVGGGAAEVAAGSCKRVSGTAQTGGARAIDALADARPLLGREHTGEGKCQ